MAYVPSMREIRKNMEYRQASRNEELRDYFAAAALAGIIASQPGVRVTPKSAAKAALEYADAMLAERSK